MKKCARCRRTLKDETKTIEGYTKHCWKKRDKTQKKVSEFGTK